MKKTIMLLTAALAVSAGFSQTARADDDAAYDFMARAMLHKFYCEGDTNIDRVARTTLAATLTEHPSADMTDEVKGAQVMAKIESNFRNEITKGWPERLVCNRLLAPIEGRYKPGRR